MFHFEHHRVKFYSLHLSVTVQVRHKFRRYARQRLPLIHTGPPEDVTFNRVRSTSFIAALCAAQRAKLDEQIGALIAAEPELRGRDVVTVPYETVAFVTRKFL
ncbi:methyltransferase [Pseudomonas fluorescens]|uniref:Methyltransferase n=1 Tax=Pseudomonas fluorescens TaxID=294 RepID=A0A448DVX6_PSEFL|nr:methyltransferase [Pseudomonas fluorescens]